MDNGFAFVQPESRMGCRRCAEGRGCGGGVFSRLLRHRLESIPVTYSGSLAPGDVVLLGLDVAAVQNAAMLVYGLPLLGLMLAVGFAAYAALSELAAVFAGLAGFTAGLLAARRISASLLEQPRYHPVILRKLQADDACPAAPQD